MDNIEILFENRWNGINSLYSEEIKKLCKMFYEYGINVSENNRNVCVSFDDFDKWWEIYDKKRGKEKCLKKWAKLTKQEREACLNVTPYYVASTPDKQYRKDPLTFINGKCWNDEIIQISNGRKQITDDDRAGKLADILLG